MCKKGKYVRKLVGPEAAGCYCKINSYLKEVIGILANRLPNKDVVQYIYQIPEVLLELPEFSKLSLKAKNVIPITAQCTVFAESEVISLI